MQHQGKHIITLVYYMTLFLCFIKSLLRLCDTHSFPLNYAEWDTLQIWVKFSCCSSFVFGLWDFKIIVMGAIYPEVQRDSVSSLRSGSTCLLVQSLRRFGTWGIFSLAVPSQRSSPPPPSYPNLQRNCWGACLYMCMLAWASASLHMHVCLCFSLRHSGEYCPVRDDDDEWCSALQMFLNSE